MPESRKSPCRLSLAAVVLLLAGANTVQAALDCTNPTVLSCPTNAAPFANRNGPNGETQYGCIPGNTYQGKEAVFRLDLTSWSNLTITLDNTDGKNRHVFFLNSCDALNGCLVGGTTTLWAPYVFPGTYYIVVDGVTNNDNGNFNLDIQCKDVATTIPCGTTLAGETTVGGPTNYTNYSCISNLTGPERYYVVNAPGPGTLTASLTNKSSPRLRVLLSTEAGMQSTPPNCRSASQTQVVEFGAAGRYILTVDATQGTAGTYDLSVTCGGSLKCPSPPNVIDLENPVTVQGDTTGKLNNVTAYNCAYSAYGPAGTRTGYTGPEDVYEFTLKSPDVVAFLFNPSNPDLRLLILSDCYEGTCVAEGGCHEQLPAGNYRLVVDGVNGASGRYSITPLRLSVPPYNRWQQCPECINTQQCTSRPGDIFRKEWHFWSGNFCGTGCDFSLYAVVECGTSFHIPFYDVETGHMRIRDMLNQQDVRLTAVNDATGACAYSTAGTYVAWEDSGCSAIPCPPANCGGGTDCRTNNRIMDVSFEGTPNVCGVYRLDFLNWGGYEWWVYANCTADRTEQYNLYHDFCSAMASYRPLPEVGIANVTVSNDPTQCAAGMATGTITLDAVGCQPVAGMEIVIDQKPPLPSNPRTLVVDMQIGQQLVVPWSYPITQQPANLVFTVDPANKVRECSENTGTTVSCGFNETLTRSAERGACVEPCATSAEAGPPRAVCQGAIVTLDGSSSLLNCTMGLGQYRWEDSGGAVLPGCDWSPSPLCTIDTGTLAPGQHDFTLLTRCEGALPACISSSTTSLTVAPGGTPPRIGNSLAQVKSGTDVVASWTIPAGTNATMHRLYKDVTKWVDTGSRQLVGEVAMPRFSVIEWGGVTAAPKCAYFQAVGVSCNSIESPY